MSWLEQGISAYFNGRALMESMRGSRDAKNMASGVSPQATATNNSLIGLGQQAQGHLGGLQQDYQRGRAALTPGYDAYRGSIAGLRDGGLYRDYAQSAGERAAQWGELQKDALAESMLAGSDERIRQARTTARADAMSGLQDVMALQAQQQMAMGQAPGGGQMNDADMQGRYGNILGQAENQAGEQERMYGEAMRQSLLPQAQMAQAQALQAAHMEADSYKMEAQSFVEQGQAALGMLNPYMQTMGQVAGVYSNSINSAVGIAQANAAAAEAYANSSGNLANNYMAAGGFLNNTLGQAYQAAQKNGTGFGGFANAVGNAFNTGMGAVNSVAGFLNNPLVQMIPGMGQLAGVVNTVGNIGNTVGQAADAASGFGGWLNNMFTRNNPTPRGGTKGGSDYSANTSRPSPRRSSPSKPSPSKPSPSKPRTNPSSIPYL